MTKSDLIDRMASEQTSRSERDVEDSVKALLQQMSDALASGDRIEIRGFGSFSLHTPVQHVSDEIRGPPRLFRFLRGIGLTSSPARSCGRG